MNRSGGRLSISRSGAMGRSHQGLTLLELLVVLVLVSLLGTLLVQGVGFFLGRYETVQRVQRESMQAMLRQHWFAFTVRGMVPYRQPDRQFRGDSSSFRGITIQPLVAPSGMPVDVRWAVETEGASGFVRYEEAGVSSNAAVGWTLRPSTGESLSFQYADESGRWHETWPSRESRGRIPRMVRLISASDRTVWLAHLDLFPDPVLNYREFD